MRSASVGAIRAARADKVEAGGLKFNVSTLGEGEEVVLMIHGLFVDNLSSWYLTAAPALDHVARRRRDGRYSSSSRASR